ncbi:MAG: hypothetical protein DYG89_32830 [Caldilinea sp. CFX5]|nr:hypothetical protein [Caldilinea sp. CFX5]
MTIATTGISCFRGCGQPVIGQCQGYQEACGRFYCATHSIGKLCSECGERKLKDEEDQKRQALEAQAKEEIIAHYTQVAERVEKELAAAHEQRMKDFSNRAIGIAFLLSFGLMIYLILATESAAIGIALFVLSITFMALKTIDNQDKKKAYDNSRLAEIALEYHGFDKFFPEWKNLKALKDEAERREKAKAFNAVVALLAGAAVDTYKFVEKEVKKEKS